MASFRGRLDFWFLFYQEKRKAVKNWRLVGELPNSSAWRCAVLTLLLSGQKKQKPLSQVTASNSLKLGRSHLTLYVGNSCVLPFDYRQYTTLELSAESSSILMHCLIIPCGSRALVLLEQKEAYAECALLLGVMVWTKFHFHSSQA